MDVLKNNVQLCLHTCIHPQLVTCAKQVANGSNSTPYFSMMRSVNSSTDIIMFSGMRPVVPDITKRYYKIPIFPILEMMENGRRGIHVHKCRCTIP